MIAYEIVLSRYPNCLQQNFESLTSIGSRSIVFAVNRTSTIMSTPAKSTPTMSTPAEKGTYAPEPAEEDKYLIQYVTAFSASILMLACSSTFAWVSPMLPKLVAPDSPIPITSDEGGWIVLSMMIGRAASVIPGAWMMDRFGRKTTMLYSAGPIILGWAITLYANRVEHLYAARVLWGITLGIVHSVVLPMYLGEIGSDKIRGSISIMLGIMAKSGVFLVYAVGPFVSMFTLSWMGMILPILFVVTFVWLPESPYYLLGKNRHNDALKSLQRLRGHANVSSELNRMADMVKKSAENNGSFRQFLEPGNRRGLIIVMGLASAIILTGTEAMLSFSQLIFEKVGGVGLDGSVVNIIFGAFLVATTILASCTVDKFGRRPLLLYSTVGLIVCNITIAVFFLLIQKEVDLHSVSWVPMMACMMYIFCYGMGLATVAFAVMGEILPKHLKAVAGVIFGLTISLLSLVVSKLFQIIADNLGHHVIFFGFAFFSCLFFPFVWFLIPETKGKPLEVILAELNKSK